MKTNPADSLKDVMWGFLMTGGQKANIPALKGYVYDLIQATTQRTGGQDGYKKADHISFTDLDMIWFSIVIEASALVLSGELDELMKLDREVLQDILTDHKLCHRQAQELQKVVDLLTKIEKENK